VLGQALESMSCTSSIGPVPAMEAAALCSSSLDPMSEILVKVLQVYKKNVEGCRDGRATKIETRCRDSSVQARNMLYKDYKTNPIPTSFLYLKLLARAIFEPPKRYTDGVSCVVFV